MKELIGVLRYDSLTGLVTWAKDCGGKDGKIYKKGAEAGSLTHGYREVGYNYNKYKIHRVAWFLHHGTIPEGEVDHINHIRDDNRIANLRDIPREDNRRNLTKKANNKSGCTNVYFAKWANKYRVGIRVEGKKKHIGYYKDYDEAVQASKDAKIKYGFHANHGE